MRHPVNIVLQLLLISTFLMTASFPAFPVSGEDLEVVAESSGYTKTSSTTDVASFLSKAQEQSEHIRLLTLGTTTEGRRIPLVVLSTEGIKSPRELVLSGKPAVLIMANIHAGEVEGKESTQMLIREFVKKDKKALALLENQVILIIPIFNMDGNDKFGNNRGDNGPELAGMRPNGQFLDLNRDYLKLETPEVNALVTLFNQWDPVLFVDMHTTNGSWHQEPVTYITQMNPNGDKTLEDYMWNQLFPAVAKTLKETYGFDSIPYGNFVDRADPEKGWYPHAHQAMFGTNYAGLRNRFTILDENYAHADFKTRVLGSFGFIKAILQYTNQHISQMKELVKKADQNTQSGYYKEDFTLEFKPDKLFDFTIKSYVFTKEKIKPEDKHKYPWWVKDYMVHKTDTLKNYRLPYLAKTIPTRTVSLPEAYVVLPYNTNVIDNLKLHGISVEKISAAVKHRAEIFNISEIKPAKGIYQGNVAINLTGKYESKEITIPEGSYFISMKQPLARLIPLLLEPESVDNLARWGYLNRKLVRQWSNKTNPYPVYRILEVKVPIRRFQE
ncbi:MAG: M14 family metallopeptidase [bacterium]|nr:M14 family metallopeptidase [bacterium]